MEHDWLIFLFRQVDQPPVFLRDVLGRSRYKYNELRSSRMSILISSIVLIRKLCIFITQDFKTELPSQLELVQRPILDSLGPAELAREALLYLEGTLTTFPSAFTDFLRVVRDLTSIKLDHLPMLWTSSFSGPFSWSQGGRDPQKKVFKDLLKCILLNANPNPIVNWLGGYFAMKRDTNVSWAKPPEPNSAASVETPFVGRISLLREYGGKNRCFAIPSSFCQFALYPIHLYMFKILRTLPSDFTHDQQEFRRQLYAGRWGTSTRS